MIFCIVEKKCKDLKRVLEIYNIPPDFCFNIDGKVFISFIDVKTQSIVVPI